MGMALISAERVTPIRPIATMVTMRSIPVMKRFVTPTITTVMSSSMKNSQMEPVRAVIPPARSSNRTAEDVVIKQKRAKRIGTGTTGPAARTRVTVTRATRKHETVEIATEEHSQMCAEVTAVGKVGRPVSAEVSARAETPGMKIVATAISEQGAKTVVPIVVGVVGPTALAAGSARPAPQSPKPAECAGAEPKQKHALTPALGAVGVIVRKSKRDVAHGCPNVPVHGIWNVAMLLAAPWTWNVTAQVSAAPSSHLNEPII